MIRLVGKGEMLPHLLMLTMWRRRCGGRVPAEDTLFVKIKRSPEDSRDAVGRTGVLEVKQGVGTGLEGLAGVLISSVRTASLKERHRGAHPGCSLGC